MNSTAALGIDFGTSNTAVSFADAQGHAGLVPLEGANTVLPSAIFFPHDGAPALIGRAAVAAYIAGDEGRLMRSLKSILGSPLMDEKTVVQGRAVSFTEILEIFLAKVVERVGAFLGELPRHVTLGRPVHFHDTDPERDAKAEATLKALAQRLGFDEVRFRYEPIAAASDYERMLARDVLTLVADIGGGTSDFCLARLGPGRKQARGGGAPVLSTSGVHVAGNDFDSRLDLELVMPLLGYRHHGRNGREVPSSIFFDLSTWHLIPFAQSRSGIQRATDMRPFYDDLALHRRLMRVVQEGLGHHLLADVEQLKIALGTGTGAQAFAMDYLDAALEVSASRAQADALLAKEIGDIVGAAMLCVLNARRACADVEVIYLTGGSSALSAFRAGIGHAFPNATLVEGDTFGSVALGLVTG
ncbi:MAG: Hsp70 family protein [Pseudomonadota bacterium]